MDLFIYRAVDSSGDTIDFLLSPTRDAGAAKRFFQKALRAANHPRPRVVNVDGNPAYPKAIEELKQTRELGRRCRCRPVRYLNNAQAADVVEFDAQGARINGKELPNSSPLVLDIRGRQLSPWRFGRFNVETGTVWVISSYNVRSFDSRYFGPLSLKLVQHRLRPLVVFDNKGSSNRSCTCLGRGR